MNGSNDLPVFVGSFQIQWCGHHDRVSNDPRRDDGEAFVRLASRHIGDVFVMQGLRRMLRRAGHVEIYRLRDKEVLQQIGRALGEGTLRLERRKLGAGPSTLETTRHETGATASAASAFDMSSPPSARAIPTTFEPPSEEVANDSTAASSPLADVASGIASRGGTVVYSDEAAEIMTGVAITLDGQDTQYKDAIAIKVKCDKHQLPETVQFIHREIIDPDGNRISRKMKTTGGEYFTTTDPTSPHWNTDSSDDSNPRYEANGTSLRNSSGLTIYDQPSLLPASGETWRATFKTFLICDGKVVREVSWVRSMEAGSKPTYDVTVQPCSELPDWAKKQLKKNGYGSLF